MALFAKYFFLVPSKRRRQWRYFWEQVMIAVRFLLWVWSKIFVVAQQNCQKLPTFIVKGTICPIYCPHHSAHAHHVHAMYHSHRCECTRNCSLSVLFLAVLFFRLPQVPDPGSASASASWPPAPALLHDRQDPRRQDAATQQDEGKGEVVIVKRRRRTRSLALALSSSPASAAVRSLLNKERIEQIVMSVASRLEPFFSPLAPTCPAASS